MKYADSRPSSLHPAHRVLICISILLGIAAASRRAGAGGITLQSVLLLSVAFVAALRPLICLIGGDRRKTILAVVFGVHVISTLFFFTPEDIVNSRPVLSLDHALHYQQAVRAEEVFRNSYRLHAYDPFFMAGYPGGTVFDIDSKGVELWCAFLGFIGTPRAYKLFILMGYLLLPITLYGGSRRLGFCFGESLYSTLVMMAFWHWGRPYIGEFRYAGMFSSLTVAHLSIYIIGLFKSFLRRERTWRFWIVGPLTFLIHPTAAVLLPVPFLALFLVERHAVSASEAHGKWQLRILGGLVAWCLIVIAVNAIWLVPFFRYLDIKVASETFFQVEGIGGLLAILVRPGNLPALLLVALSITGLGYLLKGGRSGDAAGPVAGSLFLLFIAAFGIYIPIFDQMEPGRFLVPALIFMAPLSGAGLAALFSGARKIVPSGSVYTTVRAAVMITLLVSSPVFALVASRSYYHHTLSTTYTPEVEQLIGALERNADPSGRLMIEDGPAWNYGDCFLPAIIPQITGVEQIGGPYPWAFIIHNFTNFHMCRAMGKPLREMSPGMLLSYIELYNIRWILTSTPECREQIGLFTGRAPLWSSRHFSLWEVGPDGGFLEARGITIHSSYDRIEVTLNQDENGLLPGSVILPYHWDRGLHVDPPAVISREQRMDDPVPFIVLEPNGESNIRIEYR